MTYKVNFESIIENFKLGFSSMTGLRNPTYMNFSGQITMDILEIKT